jgi:subtilisin family serine protease
MMHMGRIPFLVKAILILMALLFNHISVLAADDQGLYTENKVIVEQVNVLTGNDFSANQLRNYEIVKVTNLDGRKIMTLKVPEGQSPEQVISEVSGMPGVLLAEHDHKLKRDYVPQDSGFSYQWFHQKINTPAAWDQTKGSASITVAVIDDTVDIYHPDLRNRIVSPYDAARNSSMLSYPDGDHGTHIAGIIAAAMDNGIGGTGIAPRVNIMPINVFIGDNADTSDLIAAIEYAINHNANIINLSLGFYQYSSLLNQVIQKAYQKGIIIVAAAGNDSTSQASYPAAFDHVISVSSINDSNYLSDYSNYGTTIDLAAPGERIYSTIPGGAYDFMSGTSMAAPIVTGVAALVWSQNPELTPKQVEESLFYTATDLGVRGKDSFFGYGLVNAKNAINYYVPVKGEWKFANNNWYYYENGVMKSGWVKSGGKWYYLNHSGVMQTGWVLYNSKWYFLADSGEMKIGWLFWNGSWYYLDHDGKMLSGWIYVYGNWYFLGQSGDMKTGWIEWADKWYYLYSDGSMAKNTTIHGYKLGSDGAWIH